MADEAWERRSGKERRLGKDRRQPRSSFVERIGKARDQRSEEERRSGKDRRKPSNGDTVLSFHNDDAGYLAWRASDQGSYVLTRRRPRPGEEWAYRLHHKDCSALPGPTGTHELTSNPKWCGSRDQLAAFARMQRHDGGDPELCAHCI